MRELRNKKIIIVGMAKSGLSAALLLKSKEADVFVTDSKSANELKPAISALENAGISYETDQHSVNVVDGCDFLVLSPGVPEDIQILRRAKDRGIPYYSEIEVASWFCNSPIIGVTGSNGKTTTTSLIGDLIQTTFPNSFVGGNIGTPFCDGVDSLQKNDFAVLELSSFQLLNINYFRPNIAVLLNFSPDHLDRHKTYDGYIAAKMRLIKNQQKDDYFIYNQDDPIIRENLTVKSKKISFSDDPNSNADVFLQNGFLKSRMGETERNIVELSRLKLKGKHNYMNVAAAVAAAQCAGISEPNITEALLKFEPIEHRLEFVRELDGVRFYNDSKATNSDAAKQALKSFDTPIILLAGGYAKEFDYSHLAKLVNERVRICCLFGRDREKLFNDLNCENANTFIFDTLDQALERAVEIAQPGENVLLSPMCASFDQFSSFEERGRHFKNLVNKL